MSMLRTCSFCSNVTIAIPCTDDPNINICGNCIKRACKETWCWEPRITHSDYCQKHWSVMKKCRHCKIELDEKMDNGIAYYLTDGINNICNSCYYKCCLHQNCFELRVDGTNECQYHLGESEYVYNELHKNKKPTTQQQWDEFRSKELCQCGGKTRSSCVCP